MTTKGALAVLLLLAAVLVAADDPAPCEKYHDAGSCNTASQGSAESCHWCRSAAVPASCQAHSHALAMPSSVFSCDNLNSATAAASSTPAPPTPAPRTARAAPAHVRHADSCASIGDSRNCQGATVNGDACAWCDFARVAGSAMPSQCVNQSIAQHVGPAVCQSATLPTSGDPHALQSCSQLTVMEACQSVVASGYACVWCEMIGGNNMARRLMRKFFFPHARSSTEQFSLPSGLTTACLNENAAKGLPTSSFHCHFHAQESSAASAPVEPPTPPPALQTQQPASPPTPPPLPDGGAEFSLSSAPSFGNAPQPVVKKVQ